LKRKSSIRDVEVRKSSYDEEIRNRAAEGYDIHIREQAPGHFVPFGEAWQEVLALVQSLDIVE
jgi:hypothetical protein